MRSVLGLALLAACLAMPARAADLPLYAGTVVRVVDGDSVIVSVAAWANTPFDPISVQLYGIDTPESRKPPAKCVREVVLGKAASAYAKTLLKQRDAVTLIYRGRDKYGGRIDADLAMPDVRDFAAVMLASGKAFPYAGCDEAAVLLVTCPPEGQDLNAVWILMAGIAGLIVGSLTGSKD